MFLFGFFKWILIGIIAFIIITVSSISTGWKLPKDEIINSYNTFLQSFDFARLSKDKDLEGERSFGIDKYVGTYKAEYDNVTSEETIFGGTALNRKNGEYVNLKIKIEKESGSINVIAKLGNNGISLINENGEYEDNLYIEGGSYYLTIKLDNFNANFTKQWISKSCKSPNLRSMLLMLFLCFLILLYLLQLDFIRL